MVCTLARSRGPSSTQKTLVWLPSQIRPDASPPAASRWTRVCFPVP